MQHYSDKTKNPPDVISQSSYDCVKKWTYQYIQCFFRLYNISAWQLSALLCCHILSCNISSWYLKDISAHLCWPGMTRFDSALRGRDLHCHYNNFNWCLACLQQRSKQAAEHPRPPRSTIEGKLLTLILYYEAENSGNLKFEFFLHFWLLK